MRGCIGVRINDGVSDRNVTADARGLKFSKCSDGGHKAASLTVNVPRGAFIDLGPADKVYLYDTRSGLPLFEGYTSAPTPTSGPNGDSYAISALGGMIRAADESRGLIYVDHVLSDYAKGPLAMDSSSIETGPWVNDESFQRVRTSINGGGVVVTNAATIALYDNFARGDMYLGGIRVGSLNSGRSDTGYNEEIVTAFGNVFARNMGTTGASVNSFAGDPGITAGVLAVALQLRRVGGATNVNDDSTWTDFVDVSVIGRRVDRYGALLTGSAGLVSNVSVLAHQVVEDLLGRMLRFCDPTASSVTTTAHAIDQLAYPDGTTSQRVLDDLSDYEPDMQWEILHSTPLGHIFNYRPWPTDPRYEIGTADGYAETGSDADLCNRVLVTWTDPAGATQTTPVTATSAQYSALQALEVTGRVRDADPITLPEGLGSFANAQAIGAAILADAAGQSPSARATVRRPIRDLYTGSMVMPWEMEPGYIVRVRETGANLRLTEMEYDDESCSTSLTLGYPSLTRDQRIAQFAA